MATNVILTLKNIDVFVGIIVKQQFFDPLEEEALYDDGEFWEVG